MTDGPVLVAVHGFRGYRALFDGRHRRFAYVGEVSHPDVGLWALWRGVNVGRVVGADRYSIWVSEVLDMDGITMTVKSPPRRYPRSPHLILSDVVPPPRKPKRKPRDEAILDHLTTVIPETGWSRLRGVRELVNEMLAADGLEPCDRREWVDVVYHSDRVQIDQNRGIRQR